MNMNKILAFFISVLTTVLLISGCGSTQVNTLYEKPSDIQIKPVNDQEAQYQIGSNDLVIEGKSQSMKSLMELYVNDLRFKNFKDTGMSNQEYEQWFLNTAKNKGMDESQLKKSLGVAKVLKGDKTIIYPVIVDVAKFQNRDAFVLVFTWEGEAIAGKLNSVRPLGHIFIVVIQSDNQKVITSESCK